MSNHTPKARTCLAWGSFFLLMVTIVFLLQSTVLGISARRWSYPEAGEPDLSTSKKISSSPGKRVETGALITYTVTLTNTGGAAVSVALTDTLSPYYRLFKAQDFEQGQSDNTLTWHGTVGDQSVSLQFVARVEDLQQLPLGTTILDNAVRLDDGVNSPFDVQDKEPPKVIIGETSLLLVHRNRFGDAYEPNDRVQQAYGPLSGNQPYFAYFSNQEDRDDYYYIELASLQRVVVELSVPDSLDLDLWVYDTNLNLVSGSNRSGRGQDERASLTPEASGRYYIRVYRFDTQASGDQYQLMTLNALSNR